VPPQPDPNSVFLNIPYDEEFRDLYLAYIVGLFQLGLIPHLSSEIPGGERRLDRILALIQKCRYSIHDLSRVEVSVSPSGTPRFNMPLELGMTITWASLKPERHTWFVWEAEPYRLLRSTSDLNGTDPHVHEDSPRGVLSELRSAFFRRNAPSMQNMLVAYERAEDGLERILANAGTRNLFAASVFHDLCYAAEEMALRAGVRPSQ
jgi:hypothetical protein